MSRWAALLPLLLACGGKSAPPPAGANVADSPKVVAAPTWTAEQAALPVSDADPSWGSKLAPVTLVIFSDMQCSYCRKVEGTLHELREHFGPERLRIVWKHRPIFEGSEEIAVALAGVFALGGAEAFWRVQAQLFSEHEQLKTTLRGSGAEVAFEAVQKGAERAGVDLARLREGLKQQTWASKVKADEALAAQLDINGTPTMFINGQRLSGAVGFEMLRMSVEQEATQVAGLRGQGIAADEIYARRTAHYLAPAAPEEEEEDDDESASALHFVPVAGSPTRGAADALVTVVVFSDFECPFCVRMRQTLDELHARYPKELRVVWKDHPLPFHQHARRAAAFAREARAQKGEAGFWLAHDKLFELSPRLDKSDLTVAARDLGLDLGKIQRAVRTGAFEPVIEADEMLGDQLQVDGTPTIFVNGRKVSGARPTDWFAQLIDEELVKAKALVRAGTPASAVYSTIMQGLEQASEMPSVRLTAAAMAPPRRGGANAKVVITTFSDFDCPFCARAEQTLEALLARYGNQLAIEARELPLDMHPRAQLAAEAAREAYAQKGNTGYWRLRELLFANKEQRSLDELVELGKQAGLNGPSMRRALEASTHRAAVLADVAAAERASIRGTPAFVIGRPTEGFFLSGALPERSFVQVIDRAFEREGVKPKAVKPSAKAGEW